MIQAFHFDTTCLFLVPSFMYSIAYTVYCILYRFYVEKMPSFLRGD